MTKMRHDERSEWENFGKRLKPCCAACEFSLILNWKLNAMTKDHFKNFLLSLLHYDDNLNFKLNSPDGKNASIFTHLIRTEQSKAESHVKCYERWEKYKNDTNAKHKPNDEGSQIWGMRSEENESQLQCGKCEERSKKDENMLQLNFFLLRFLQKKMKIK